VLALAAGFFSCRGAKPVANNANRAPEPPSPAATAPQPEFTPVEAAVMERYTPFSHTRPEHKKLDCTLCHQRLDNDVTPKFPGHSACTDCHDKDFSSTTSQLCVACHKMPVDAQGQLVAFPQRMRQLGLKGFSHRQHMTPDASKWPANTPSLKCADCHRLERGLESSFPKHAECYSCHSHQSGEKLGECATCHVDRAVALKYTPGAGAAFTSYNFKHASHQNRASCDRCHRITQASAKSADIQQISTARGQRHNSTCFSCHSQARETVCSKCHIGSVPF
jgi:hypothetical protein